MKKPIYNKWWFITSVVLTVLAVLGNSLGEPTKSKKPVITTF